MNFSFAVIFPNIQECANDHLDLVWMMYSWFLQVKVWNLTKRECLRTVQAHEGFVRGICSRYCGTSFSRYFNPAYSIMFLDIDEDNLFSKRLCSYVILWNLHVVPQVGDDKTIKQWNMEAPGYGVREIPINTILGKVQFYLTHIIIKCRNDCVYLNKNTFVL